MAQLIIDTLNDNEQTYRAAAAFCRMMAGDDVDTVRYTECAGDVSRTVDIRAFSDIMDRANEHVRGEEPAPQPEVDIEAPTDVVEFPSNTVEAAEPENSNLDAEGLPWDKRIHSSSKATVKDGTWRMRKQPKDQSDAEWSAFVEQVKGELRQAVSGEPIVASEPAQQPEAPAPEPTPDAAAAFGGQPGSRDGTPVVETPSPTPAPVEAPAPAPDAAPTQSRQLPEVMQLITGNMNVLTNDLIKAVLDKHGVSSLGLLKQAEEARPGTITTVYNELAGHVNG